MPPPFPVVEAVAVDGVGYGVLPRPQGTCGAACRVTRGVCQLLQRVPYRRTYNAVLLPTAIARRPTTLRANRAWISLDGNPSARLRLFAYTRKCTPQGNRE